MSSKTEKKNWRRHLLVIPVLAVADTVLMTAAVMLDRAGAAAPAPEGPAPGFTVIFGLILFAVTAILGIRALFLTVKSISPEAKAEPPEKQEKEQERDPEEDPER